MPTKVIYSKKRNATKKPSAVRKPKRAGAANSKQAAPRFKVIIDSDGCRQKLQTLDVHSRSFGQDFGEAFKKSVRKARRENTRIIGRPDIAVGK